MKVLLLSDATMSANAGGIYQTLYNLFSFFPAEDILCIAPESEVIANPPPEQLLPKYLTYKFEILKTPRNRLARYIRPFNDWFNYSYNNKFRKFRKAKKAILEFDPDVVVSCSNGTIGAFMHHKLLKGSNIKNVIPYFMDDWMRTSKLSWLGGNIRQSIKEILTNKSWIMISDELSDILKKRYDVYPQRILVAHNPVDLSNAPIATPLVKKEAYTLAYAGALWPMHFDSFNIVAKSVFKLKSTIDVNLILYSAQNFWDWRKPEIEPLGVIYGGSIPYNNIHQKLSEADALIVCSSFSEEWHTHSEGSIQTKITDYLKSKRLIISCGPSYSANHNFIKKYKCGICIETDDVAVVEKTLKEILTNIEDYNELIDNGWQLLEREYTFDKVHEKLNYFLLDSIN